MRNKLSCVALALCALGLLSGCANQAIREQPSQAAARSVSQTTRGPITETETFKQRIRKRANLALTKAGANSDQKTAVDELLIFNAATLSDCVGGSERRLLRTLSILASSENQGQALEALEKADIPLSDKCFMLGSDMITEFTETLDAQQRESLVAEWRLMDNKE